MTPAHGAGAAAGYDESCADVDVLLMGRRTDDVVRTFGEWRHGTGRHRLTLRSATPAGGGAVRLRYRAAAS